MALIRRGLNVTWSSCVLCPNGVDSCNHLLASWPYFQETLTWIFKWCDIPYQLFNSVPDIINFAASWVRCPKKKKTFSCNHLWYLWCVWKARNDKFFNKWYSSPTNTTDCIISMVFNWENCMGSFGTCNWADWFCCPFENL